MTTDTTFCLNTNDDDHMWTCDKCKEQFTIFDMGYIGPALPCLGRSRNAPVVWENLCKECFTKP